MLQVPRRPGSSGQTLIRLLARLTDVESPGSVPSLSDQLGQWLGWADAIALSAALTGEAASHPLPGRAAGSAQARECARVRAALSASIAGDSAFGGHPRRQPRPLVQGEAKGPQLDFAFYRQRYLSMQQAMETAIGALRGRLRAALLGRDLAMARLAAVDAVMERVLGTREQSLLDGVPFMLEAHFERLRQGEAAALADRGEDPRPTVTPGAWLTEFRRDMQNVLLAELDLRFQPIDALLAALHAR